MEKTVKIATSDELKLRVARCKTRLTELGVKHYMKSFIEAYPKYDSFAEVTRITAIFQLRGADEQVTKEIESFTEGLQK